MRAFPVVSAFAALAVAACSAPATVCAPGATQPCICPSTESGAQRCDDDGARWEACRCEAAPAAPPPSGPAAAPPASAAPPPPEPAPVEGTTATPVPRPLLAMIEDVRPSDVAERFVWVRTQDLPEEDHAELFCGPAAVDAARRAVSTFSRSDVACDEASCTYAHEGGNATPYLFGAPAADGAGAVLIGFWDGLAGDVRRERLERWRDELACGQTLPVTAAVDDEE